MVEVLITVSIMVLLMTTAIPAITGWTADARVRTTAEALQNGLRQAQSAAVERNRVTVFVMTAGTPTWDADPADDGGNWYLRVQPLEGSEARPDEDSLIGVYDETRRASVQIDGPGVLCFGPLGQQVTKDSDALELGAGCTAPNTAAPTEYTVTHPSGSRRLKVQVSLGGRIRMCDAEKTLSEDSPDGC